MAPLASRNHHQSGICLFQMICPTALCLPCNETQARPCEYPWVFPLGWNEALMQQMHLWKRGAAYFSCAQPAFSPWLRRRRLITSCRSLSCTVSDVLSSIFYNNFNKIAQVVNNVVIVNVFTTHVACWNTGASYWQVIDNILLITSFPKTEGFFKLWHYPAGGTRTDRWFDQI